MSDTLLFSGARTSKRSECEARALKAASGLRDYGIERGDRIALLLRNDVAFFEATRAATLLGASPVAVNWHLAPPEVAYVLEDSGAKVLIAHTDLLQLLGNAIPSGILVLKVETPPELLAAYRHPPAVQDAAIDAVAFDDFIGSHPPLTEPCRDFTDTMTYTSGTTGKPKGVLKLPQAPDLAKEFLAVRDRLYGIKPGIRALICGPLYHGAPNSFGTRTYAVADKVFLMPRFDAEDFLAMVEQEQITTVFMVPTMFARLLKLPEDIRDRYDVSSLEYIVTAAAHCPPEVKAAMQAWFGPVIYEFYAGTEQNYVTYCTPKDSLRKPGTVGRALAGVTMRIVDENRQDLPVGTPGEIVSRLETAPEFTYANNPAARQDLDVDGLIATGDIGYLDEDGYLFLCDRAKDMVISGGVNIYPAEIEAELHAMPGVADCAIFGVPDPDYGEALMAVVHPAGEGTLTAEQVMTYLKERLAGFKVPRRIEFRSDLPRDDSGKIYKRKLRDPYWAAEQAAPAKAAS
ncbi:acyl-CoA synthetase [Labrenzia sp. PHM005]|uniref:acyl-CoA synthetase n=1 Tax=Labrenzia sp. PHM005 TaxID=2590016 RepID=UPI0011404727|nr:acyl-CoA synthetase [Labrenzia sp. PHM005]QDG74894.1 AMP-binding protein [Labrenzia sp. PHM005]